jgi:hypothetical protein
MLVNTHALSLEILIINDCLTTLLRFHKLLNVRELNFLSLNTDQLSLGTESLKLTKPQQT